MGVSVVGVIYSMGVMLWRSGFVTSSVEREGVWYLEDRVARGFRR